jgi:RNA polymerase sigma-70 factor (ECF subfamily)
VRELTTEPPAAFRRLLRDAADDLGAYLERRLSTPVDAADVLAETLRHAWRRAEDVPTDPERRRMWLFTIAANVLAAHHHSRRRRRSGTERLRQDHSTATEPDHTEATAVGDALRLHAAQRELVMLIHWDGLSIVEAAEILGLTASTAGGRYAAAREHLRQAVVSAACT